MYEKLRTDVLEASGDKEDISHLANRMFDQNVDSFAEGETMNRDYLHHIYGESMDFLNKEVRLTRTKYYEMREDVEKSFTESLQQEKKKFVIVLVIFLVLMIFVIVSFCISSHSFDVYHELYELSFYEWIDKADIRAYWAQGGLFFGIGWMVLVISVTVFGAFAYSTIKNVRQYKKKRKRALEILEENKREQMLLGLYDTSR